MGRRIDDSENGRCGFPNCFHVGEPFCAVGEDWDRYPHYIALLEEVRNREKVEKRVLGTKRESEVRYFTFFAGQRNGFVFCTERSFFVLLMDIRQISFAFPRDLKIDVLYSSLPYLRINSLLMLCVCGFRMAARRGEPCLLNSSTISSLFCAAGIR